MHVDCNVPGFRLAAHIVEEWELLELLLKLVSHQVHGVGNGRAPPHRLYEHDLDGIGRILAATQTAISPRSREHAREHQKKDKRPVAQS